MIPFLIDQVELGMTRQPREQSPNGRITPVALDETGRFL